jgi:hypothetical protein
MPDQDLAVRCLLMRSRDHLAGEALHRGTVSSVEPTSHSTYVTPGRRASTLYVPSVDRCALAHALLSQIDNPGLPCFATGYPSRVAAAAVANTTCTLFPPGPVSLGVLRLLRLQPARGSLACSR